MLLLVTAYLAAVGYLYVFQRSFVFAPGGTLAAPADAALPEAEIVTLTTADGLTLTGWHAPAEGDNPTVLYFHGNAGNLSGRSKRFRQIVDSGFGLAAFSYRGYPGSEGAPSQQALFVDALAAFDWLAERTKSIVVHGESLGSGVAVYVAAERPARAVVLEAPYTAVVDVAADTYPWVPVSYLMTDQFLSREHIARVDEPVLVVHGTADRVIPVEYGRRLFEAAGEPKRLAVIEGAAHGDLWDRGLWPTVLQFLAESNQPE